MTREALVRLSDLRLRLFRAIEQSLSVDGHCKSYEGQFAVVLPNYFEQGEDEMWGVTLDCYVIGPNRHYSWSAPTLLEAVTKADAEVSRWITDHDDWWSTEGHRLVAEGESA